MSIFTRVRWMWIRKSIRFADVFIVTLALSISSALNSARSEDIIFPKDKDTGDFVRRMSKERIKSFPEYALVTWGAVASPLRRFLLIRKGNGICAVKFKNFSYKSDNRPPTMFNTRSDTMSAEYDWYYQENVSGVFSDKYVKTGNGTVSIGPLVGIGRLAFQTGNAEIVCGPFKFGWYYPDIVALYLGNKSIDQGFEMAPTKWLNIKDIDLNNSSLIWFQLDENRKTKMFLINDSKSWK